MRAAGPAQGITLLLPCVMAVMGVLALAPAVPTMILAFRATPHVEFWVNMVLTVPSLCLMVFSPLAGLAGDRLGRRNLLIGALLAYAAFGVAPLFLDSLRVILATRVGVGIAEAGVLTLSTTLIGDMFDGGARDRWLGGQMAVASIGAIGCLVAGGVLGSLFGWRGPFAVYGVAAFLAIAVAALTWETGHEQTIDRRSGGWAGFPWAPMAGICAITLLASILVYAWQINVGIALTALGIVDPAKIGLYTAIVSLGVSVGTLVFQVVRRLPVVRLLAVEFAIVGTSYLTMSLSTDTGSYLVASTFNQIGAGMLMPTLLTWAVRQLSFDIRGRGTGLWQGVFSVGQFCAGLLLPLAAHVGRGPLGAYAVLGAAALTICGLATVVALAQKPPLKTAPE